MIGKLIFNQWVFSERKLLKRLDKLGIDSSNNKLVTDILIEDAMQSKKFRKHILKVIKKDGTLNSVYLQCSYSIKNKTLRSFNTVFRNVFRTKTSKFGFVPLKYDMLIKYLEKKGKMIENADFLKKLKFFSSNDYINNEVLRRNITNNLSYLDILNFFMQSPEKFDAIVNAEIVKSSKILGLSLKQVVKLLNKSPIYASSPISNIIFRMNVSEEQKNNFFLNFDKIRDLIYNRTNKEKKDVDKISFKPYSELAAKVVLNPKLKSKILNEVPQNFSVFQKAYFIYKLLCQEFVYDEEFFYLKYCVPSKNHINVSYLNSLEGGEEIICTGFSLVYAKFLEILGILFATVGYDDKIVKKLTTKHIKIRFKVGDFIIDADGANDLYQSDMVSQKIKNKVYNFELVQGDRNLYMKEIEEVDKYFESNNLLRKYDYALEMYKAIYFNENKNYSQMSFIERINLMVEIIINSKLKFFDMINMVSLLNHRIINNDVNKVIFEFIVNKNIDKDKYELNILIAYNEENDLYDNLDNNKYFIITPNKNIESLTYQELKQRFSNQQYDFTTVDRAILNLKEGVDAKKWRNYYKKS